jgi:tryptophan 2,3-dioxygenase
MPMASAPKNPRKKRIVAKRPLEPGIRLGFQRGGPPQTYSDFLKLDQLLGLQAPIQDPAQRDELLFVIIHQVSELWLKLLHAELSQARGSIRKDDLQTCNKTMARSKAIQEQLISAWKVLSTMTTADYLTFRGALGQSSGFQSVGYRLVEFILGNKDAAHLKLQAHDPAALARLEQALAEPTLYDEVLACLKRRGFPVPATVLERDFREPYTGHPEVVRIWTRIYREHDAHWDLYDLAEKLMDVEGLFQRWRFDHMTTVARIIGHQPGTGGSSGVGYLKAALNLRFFHDLYELRNALYAGG